MKSEGFLKMDKEQLKNYELITCEKNKDRFSEERKIFIYYDGIKNYFVLVCGYFSRELIVEERIDGPFNLKELISYLSNLYLDAFEMVSYLKTECSIAVDTIENALDNYTR